MEDQHHVLAVLTVGGRLSLIKGFDDIHPCSAVDDDDEAENVPCWNKGPLSSPMMEWNNEGELLCLGGHHHVQSSSAAAGLHHYANILQFYNSRGVLRFRIAVPYTQVRLFSIRHFFFFSASFSFPVTTTTKQKNLGALYRSISSGKQRGETFQGRKKKKKVMSCWMLFKNDLVILNHDP